MSYELWMMLLAVLIVIGLGVVVWLHLRRRRLATVPVEEEVRWVLKTWGCLPSGEEDRSSVPFEAQEDAVRTLSQACAAWEQKSALLIRCKDRMLGVDMSRYTSVYCRIVEQRTVKRSGLWGVKIEVRRGE